MKADIDKLLIEADEQCIKADAIRMFASIMKHEFRIVNDQTEKELYYYADDQIWMVGNSNSNDFNAYDNTEDAIHDLLMKDKELKP